TERPPAPQAGARRPGRAGRPERPCHPGGEPASLRGQRAEDGTDDDQGEVPVPPPVERGPRLVGDAGPASVTLPGLLDPGHGRTPPCGTGRDATPRPA